MEDEISKEVMGQFIQATGDCKSFCFWDFAGGPVAETPCSQCRGPGFHPWDFPGGPVAETPCSQCRGPGFHPWSGD